MYFASTIAVIPFGKFGGLRRTAAVSSAARLHNTGYVALPTMNKIRAFSYSRAVTTTAYSTHTLWQSLIQGILDRQEATHYASLTRRSFFPRVWRARLP